MSRATLERERERESVCGITNSSSSYAMPLSSYMLFQKTAIVKYDSLNSPCSIASPIYERALLDERPLVTIGHVPHAGAKQ